MVTSPLGKTNPSPRAGIKVGSRVPDQPGKDAIEVRGVRKVFGAGENAVTALDTISVSIRENEFFTLLGLPAAARRHCCG